MFRVVWNLGSFHLGTFPIYLFGKPANRAGSFVSRKLDVGCLVYHQDDTTTWLINNIAICSLCSFGEHFCWGGTENPSPGVAKLAYRDGVAEKIMTRHND